MMVMVMLVLVHSSTIASMINKSIIDLIVVVIRRIINDDVFVVVDNPNLHIHNRAHLCVRFRNGSRSRNLVQNLRSALVHSNTTANTFNSFYCIYLYLLSICGIRNFVLLSQPLLNRN